MATNSSFLFRVSERRGGTTLSMEAKEVPGTGRLGTPFASMLRACHPSVPADRRAGSVNTGGRSKRRAGRGTPPFKSAYLSGVVDSVLRCLRLAYVGARRVGRPKVRWARATSRDYRAASFLIRPKATARRPRALTLVLSNTILSARPMPSYSSREKHMRWPPSWKRKGRM